jgi:AraC-like DNA-binding protein
MKELLQIASEFSTGEGIRDTIIPNLKIIKTSVANEKIHVVYKPSLCVILQGEKDVSLADETLTYAPGEYIVVTVDLPVTGEVTEASPKKPYYCLMLELDPVMVFDILKEQVQSKIIPTKRGIFVGKIEESMTDAFIRLLKCLKNPKDVPVLSPMIIREIVYRLLDSKHGEAVKQLGIVGSQTQRIAKVIDSIKNGYAHSLKMENLAKEAGMSLASFHKYFKEITAMSPLQFQKQLRLQEARRLLMTGDLDAGSVSYEVGYESPSQFSREYTRMFGLPPKSDMKQFKKV